MDVTPFERQTPHAVSDSVARCFRAAAERIALAQSLVTDNTPRSDSEAVAIAAVAASHALTAFVEVGRGVAYAISELTDAVTNRSVR